MKANLFFFLASCAHNIQTDLLNIKSQSMTVETGHFYMLLHSRLGQGSQNLLQRSKGKESLE